MNMILYSYSLNVHAQTSSEVRGLIFSESTHLTPYSVDAF